MIVESTDRSEDTNVFISDTCGEPEKKWVQELLGILKENNLTTVELPCPMDLKQSTAEGLYINYLQIGNLVVVPQFNLKKEDANTFAIFKEVFGSSYSLVPFGPAGLHKAEGC